MMTYLEIQWSLKALKAKTSMPSCKASASDTGVLVRHPERYGAQYQKFTTLSALLAAYPELRDYDEPMPDVIP